MVTVRLMSSTDFPKTAESVGIAGKYMLAVRGLRVVRSLHGDRQAISAPKGARHRRHNHDGPFLAMRVDTVRFLWRMRS